VTPEGLLSILVVGRGVTGEERALKTRRVIVLHSGGKDSTYAVWWAQMKGWEIAACCTVLVDSNDSMMFQTDSSWISGLQSSAMGCPWLPVVSAGEPETEVSDLLQGLHSGVSSEVVEEWFEKRGINAPEFVNGVEGSWDGIVVGALRSDYQKTRIERLSAELGVSVHTPLWHHDGRRHMTDIISHGFEVMMVSVSSDGLDSSWLGEVLDHDSLEELISLSEQHRFHPDGEGGEFETLVLSGPHMSGKILIDGEARWDGTRGTWHIKSGSMSY